MPKQPTGALRTIRSDAAHDAAVVFLHGFSGSRDDTWDGFPGLLGKSIADRDLYAIGYATSMQPDIVGVWSADPDLPILATMFRTQLKIQPLDRYGKLTFIAHSMGGLVVQRALLDSDALRARVEHLLLFGTPSNGLKKASWLSFWKRQFRNMARGSEFINTLRADWTRVMGKTPPFEMRVVAGDKDQFVPPWSSLEPFDSSLQYVVPGDHLSIVKPADSDHTGLRLAVSALTKGRAAPPETRNPLALAAEVPSKDAPRLVAQEGAGVDAAAIVRDALALERSGDRPASILLLERHKDLDTDIKGTLAGRMKRIWLESEDPDDAHRSLYLYEEALEIAKQQGNSGQIYYHAINVAFMHLVALDQRDRAAEMAKLAKAHCLLAGDTDMYWNLATQAEAELYLDRPDEAMRLYAEAKAQDAEDWQFASTALQAGRIASHLRQQALVGKLDELFTPAASQYNHVFVSYAREDAKWVDEFARMMQPHLRADETLKLWVDRDVIAAGDEWLAKVKEGLEKATVAVAFVTSDFLASSFVADRELPEIVRKADEGKLTLFWVYVSPAAYEPTALAKYQAAHDPKRPLSSLEEHEWKEILKNLAEEVRAARLSP